MTIDRYGDYEIHDARFLRLIIRNARIEKLWSGGRWCEGPVYVPAARHVLFSDIPNDRILRYNEDNGDVTVFGDRLGHHNGHVLDAEGRVLACEHSGRRISRLDHDGVWRTLVERFDGKRLNSPNDVIVHRDHSVWFSDPTYGIDSAYQGEHATGEIGRANVYRFDPASQSLAAVVTNLVQPNGLAFSPDHRRLYVADTGATHVAGVPAAIHQYAVDDSGGATFEKVFAVCPNGLFDGFRVDWQGNLWTSSRDAVCCYDAEGRMLGRILIPEVVSNLCFGGRRLNRLFITAQTALYAVYVNSHAAGFQR